MLRSGAVQIVADGAEEILFLGDLAAEALVGHLQLSGALLDFHFQVGIGFLEPLIGLLEIFALSADGVHHFVEGAGQFADGVVAIDRHAGVEAPGGDGAGDAHQLADRREIRKTIR